MTRLKSGGLGIYGEESQNVMENTFKAMVIPRTPNEHVHSCGHSVGRRDEKMQYAVEFPENQHTLSKWTGGSA